MQTGKNNPWDDFVDKAMYGAGPEDPGSEFADKVLISLQAQKGMETVTAYKPLISKMSWAVIVAVISGIVVWASYFGVNLEWGWLGYLDPSMGIRDLLAEIVLPDPSTTTAYSVGIFALFICLQILLMKRRLDRQIQLN